MAEQPRVLQVNVSAGGVPKLPVERAWIGEMGVEGDRHNEPTVHGGPHRAVCLYGIEAIERLQAEGHPVEPGGVGENLTTVGVEWSTLPVGTRARVGGHVLLEIADATAPCSTQKRNFRDGRFSRISIDLHPSDSRMYARVLEEGLVAPGDPIEVILPAPDSRAEDERRLARLDRALGTASVAVWRAAQTVGYDVRLEEDGEIALVASPELPGPAFNHGLGFARLPNLAGMATEFFDRHGCVGWVDAEAPPWPDAEHTLTLAVYATDPAIVAEPAWPAGTTVRPATAEDGPAIELVARAAAAGGVDDERAYRVWRDVAAVLAGDAHRVTLLVERDGSPIATASLSDYHGTGWLRGAAVVPAARGLGLQRALTAERARLARERRCTLVGASAVPADISALNLERLGFRALGERHQYRYQPLGAGAASR